VPRSSSARKVLCTAVLDRAVACLSEGFGHPSSVVMSICSLDERSPSSSVLRRFAAACRRTTRLCQPAPCSLTARIRRADRCRYCPPKFRMSNSIPCVGTCTPGMRARNSEPGRHLPPARSGCPTRARIIRASAPGAVRKMRLTAAPTSSYRPCVRCDQRGNGDSSAVTTSRGIRRPVACAVGSCESSRRLGSSRATSSARAEMSRSTRSRATQRITSPCTRGPCSGCSGDKMNVCSSAA
jgi:hypothetical protein